MSTDTAQIGSAAAEPNEVDAHKRACFDNDVGPSIVMRSPVECTGHTPFISLRLSLAQHHPRDHIGCDIL